MTFPLQTVPSSPDPGATSVHTDATITASGSQVISGFGAKEVSIVVNVTAAPTGTSPTLVFTIQEVDPGDVTAVFGASTSTSSITAAGVFTATLRTTVGGSIKVSWTVGGTTPSFTGVYATLTSKNTTVMIGVDGSGNPRVVQTDSSGVVSTQGVSGGTPTPTVGNKSNNAVAPGSTNLGMLPAIATAAAPTYTEGNQVGLSTDLLGSLRIGGSITASNPSVGSNNAAIPTSSTQVGGSDGTNLQAARVFDADTGGGTQYVLGAVLRKSASGGSVEAGTSSDPLRVDPTGTTTQPVSDGAGSLTVDTPQLPATLVGGRLDENVGAWLGSTAPTVGQKTSANSLPVVIASDQSAVTVTGTVTASNPSVGSNGAAIPTSSTQVGGSDGTNLQAARIFDADTGGGTQYVLGAILRKSASGGSVEAGTSADPLRTDPTGTTTQPVSSTQLPAALVGGRLDTNIGAWLGSTAPSVGQKTSASSLPVVVASDQSNLPMNLAQVSGGTVTTVATGTQKVGIADSAGNAFLSAANALNSTGTGLQAAQMIAQFDDAGPTAITENQFGNLRMSTNRNLYGTIRDAAGNERGVNVTAGNALVVDGSAVTQPVSSTQLPAALVGARLDTNIGAWLGSTAPTVGQKASASSVPVVVASDQSNLPTNLVQVSGGAVTTVATGTQKVGIADSAGNAFLSAANALNSTGTGLQAAQMIAQFDDAAPTAITENQFGNLRMSANRNLYGTIRDAAGNERGVNVTAGNALVVDGSASTQPVSGTVTANIGTSGSLALDATLSAQSLVDNAAFTDGTSRVVPSGHVFDETAGTALTENDIAASRVDSKRAQVIVVEDATTRGQRQAVTSLGAAKVIDDSTGSLANGTHTAVAAAAVSILAANANRRSAIVQNVGAANIRVGVTGVTATTGFRLAPGELVTFEPPFIVTNAIFAIREGATSSTALTMEVT